MEPAPHRFLKRGSNRKARRVGELKKKNYEHIIYFIKDERRGLYGAILLRHACLPRIASYHNVYFNWYKHYVRSNNKAK